MTDLMTRLSDARPTDLELDALWAPTARAERLADLLAKPRRRRNLRRVSLAAAAAALVVGVVVLPSGGSDEATAADLHRLARSAVGYDNPVLGPGLWLHVRYATLQHDAATHNHPAATYNHEQESWLRWDGKALVIDHSISGGYTAYDVSDDHFQPSLWDPTPAFSATLPDDVDGLLAYLDSRVFGSSSHAEAMFESLVQLASSHTLPPRTLAAAFEALARIEDVTTSDVEVAGRPAVAVTYDEDLTSSTETTVFDRATGQELSSTFQSERSDFTSTTTLAEVVDHVPAGVLEEFDSHRNDVAYDDHDHPIQR